jgi:hypothetical protein
LGRRDDELSERRCRNGAPHVVANKVEAAYRRGDLFDKRRKLMDAWAAHCDRPAAIGNVVSLRGAEVSA